MLLKTNKSISKNGSMCITKQAPVGDYVLKGEKQNLVSNALSFDSNAGTSGLAQSQRTKDGFMRMHIVDNTADDAKATIKLAQEKGCGARCGTLTLEKL